MEELRKSNNNIKRTLIQEHVKGGQVLDVGCGCGGDLRKWQHVGVRCLDMCDPDIDSLREAESRSKGLGMRPKIIHGDILSCPMKKYDTICFNFSLHYIYAGDDLFFKSVSGIAKRLKPGGKLLGCIPDSDAILENTPYNDELGNMFLRKDGTGYGAFGEKLFVKLSDTPFYKDGMKTEPICYRDMLITQLEKRGIMLQSWERFPIQHPVQRFYSTFIFVKVL